MKIIDAVSIEDIRRHERCCDANVTLGSYGMDVHCPLDELQAYRVKLDAGDIDSLFLLNCGFAASTRGQTGKVGDVEREKLSDTSTSRVELFLEPPPQSGKRQVDLRCSPEMALVIVCADATRGPWIIIDGNHRAIAQYLKYGNVGDVPAYLCVHSRIYQWRYVPDPVREFP